MAKFLSSKQEIMDYLRCGKVAFRVWIEKGLPARYENGRWSAHADNIDEFLRHYTAKPLVQGRR